MASPQALLLSPAELAYLHTSLSLFPPLRPDGRSPTQFRLLVAKTGILPGTNGSARIRFADGTEAIVGVKAEICRRASLAGVEEGGEDGLSEGEARDEMKGRSSWVEVSVEIPGHRDDDAATVFLGQMLTEALLADGEFTKKLVINRRWFWRCFVDIILISPPLSYPLPLLSLTTHLALLGTRLPRLKSEGDEDPLFDDDWAASEYLFPRKGGKALSRPPITLLVMAVGGNIVFDPAKEELAVADVALAVSVGEAPASTGKGKQRVEEEMMAIDDVDRPVRNLQLLSVRTIDPPSRLTPQGVPNATNSAYGAAAVQAQKPAEARTVETEQTEGVWKPPRGGAKVKVMAAMVAKVLETGGVADEVFAGLEAVETG